MYFPGESIFFGPQNYLEGSLRYDLSLQVGLLEMRRKLRDTFLRYESFAALCAPAQIA